MSKLDVREISENLATGWWLVAPAQELEVEEETAPSVSLWEAEMEALTEDQLLAFTEAHEDE
jgi:hypothetical protein